MPSSGKAPLVAIACGGTGGHLFPGLAVGEVLKRRGAALDYFVSTKAVDRLALASVVVGRIETIEATAWQWFRPWSFAAGFLRAWRRTSAVFRERRPDAVLAMGGFTSAAPILLARRLGVPAFLHESNAIPGRANRGLARWVHTAFVGFPTTAGKLRACRVRVCGTPVRSSIQRREPAVCRAELGLAADRPTLLVMGGSQGARSINRLVLAALPSWRKLCPELQFIHFTGANDCEEATAAYLRAGAVAWVQGFSGHIDCALGAADLVISRAGASSLAEFAAMRLPAILIPYPAATEDHQLHNARVLAETGGAWICEQGRTTPDVLAGRVVELLDRSETRRSLGEALGAWHRPRAAEEMAEVILEAVDARGRGCGAGRFAVGGGLRKCRDRDRMPEVAGAAEVEVSS